MTKLNLKRWLLRNNSEFKYSIILIFIFYRLSYNLFIFELKLLYKTFYKGVLDYL